LSSGLVGGCKRNREGLFLAGFTPFSVPGWKERRVIELAEIGNDEKGKENPSRLQPTILIHRRHLRDGKKKKKN